MKTRPDSAESLSGALAAARLDGRTRHAQDLKAASAELAADPLGANAALVRDLQAANAVVLSAVLRELTGASVKLAQADGSINPLVADLLPRLQRDILAAGQALLKLTGTTAAPGKAKADGPDADQPVDVSSIVLELTESSNK